MKKSILLSLILLLFLNTSAKSQIFRIGDYGFTNTTSPYAALVGDSTIILLGNFDSGLSDAINIGFTFKFGNQFFTQFKIASNGYITFNVLDTIRTTTTPITTAARVQIIAPFARDLDSAGSNNPARISILRSGVAPSRITKIQWQNFKSFASTIVPAIASFQVWIYETSNIVELRYGSVLPGTRTGASTVQVGLKSGSTATDSVRTVQGASWTTAAVSSTTSSKTISPTDLPDSNRLYRFTPAQQQANDVTPTANVSPLGVLSSCPVFCVAPKATVRNVGMLFAAYSVTYQITGPGAPYTSTRSDTLSPGLSRTITFDSTFCPSVAGMYSLRVFTTFPSDTNRANDTLTGSVAAVNPSTGGFSPSFCDYIYSNSTTCGLSHPYRPVFGWLDTSGGTSLIIDTTVQTPPGVFVGTKDDGHWRLEIPGTDQFRFCGVDYDSFFVSTNGQIGLTLANGNTGRINSFSTLTIPNVAAIQPGLFPFWKDFNFGTVVTGSKRISYKLSFFGSFGTILLVTFDRAPNFGANLATDYASFQIILQLSPSPIEDGLIIYQYDDSRTGSEFLNKYFNYTLAGHTVGIQNVTGTLGVQYRRAAGAGMANIIWPGPLFVSPIAVAFGPPPLLPVELTSFISIVNKRDVTLNWTTATELNNSGFEIERREVKSESQGNWIKIGFINGNGTSSSPNDYTFTDRGLSTGKYNYRLKQIDFNGNFEYFNLSNEVSIGIPTRYDLSQNYPNPFNPSTKINYDLPFDGKVSIKLYDLTGREVITLVDEIKTAGYYTINFKVSNLASSTYFYQIVADANGQKFVTTKKMVILK